MSVETIVPPAQHQTSVPAAEILHSANCGLVVERVAQVRAELRDEAVSFVRQLADEVNTKQAGSAILKHRREVLENATYLLSGDRRVSASRSA